MNGHIDCLVDIARVVVDLVALPSIHHSPQHGVSKSYSASIENRTRCISTVWLTAIVEKLYRKHPSCWEIAVAATTLASTILNIHS